MHFRVADDERRWEQSPYYPHKEIRLIFASAPMPQCNLGVQESKPGKTLAPL